MKINDNNAKIESLLNPACFILNKEIESLLKENSKLRKQCQHEFVDGVCKYCGEEENK